MPVIHTIVDAVPPGRLDGQPWTIANIQESATENGTFVECDQITLSPLDTDPANPIARAFTFEGTLNEGWYRIVWEDGSGNTSPPSDALLDSPDTVSPTDYRPTVQDVADFIRARTKNNLGVEVGTFTADTRPTAAAVERLIVLTESTLARCVGPWLPDRLIEPARLVIALGTALMIELSYFPEQIEDNQSAYKAYEKLFERMRDNLCADASQYRPDDWDPGDTPLYYFGDGVAVADSVEYDFETQRYIFREGATTWVWNT